MALSFKEYMLNEAAVEAVSEEVQAYLKRLGTERQSIQRIRLTVEEILLNIMADCGGNLRVSVGIGKQFGQHLLRLRYTGAPLDPTKIGEDEWTYSLMKGLGYLPSWNYRGGTNTVSLQLAERARRSALFSIMLAVFAAAVLGLIGHFFPDSLRMDLNEVLLAPVSQGFLGLMSTFSGLMIAFTICSGILNVGDTMTLGRMGRHVLSRFVGLSFALCAVTAALVFPFLNLSLSGGTGEQSSQLAQISRMIFEILPANPVDPFLKGNAMQIIVIALFLGIGLLSIGERGSRIRELIDESAVLSQYTVALICRMIPLFVFVMLLRQIWSGQMHTLLLIWKPLLLIVGSELLLAIALWLLTSLHLKCPAMLLLKKVLPPFIVAFTTASSMSAMPLGMKTCKDKLGVRENTVSFAYPLGTVIYMPASIASFTAIAFAFAEIYRVEVNLSWVVAAVFTVTLLVIAMPPIPGAGLLVYSILFARLGIPAEALVLATAIDVAVDYCNTGFNVLLLILQIACQGKSLGSMDQEILMNGT